MLREATLISGIGVRLAHNILCTLTKDVLIDRVLTSAPNAKQKKKTKTAQHKDPALTFVLRIGSWNVCEVENRKFAVTRLRSNKSSIRGLQYRGLQICLQFMLT